MPWFNLPSEVGIDCGFTMTTKAEGWKWKWIGTINGESTESD